MTTSTPKDRCELKNVGIGKKIILVFNNGEDYTGIYRGMDGENTIMLKACDTTTTLGLPFNRVKFFLEVIS
jgi:hypothetical protein